MAGNNFREENGAGTSSDAAGGLRFQPSDSVVEWRMSDQLENGTPSTSPPYWETEDEDDSGPRPADLYGKFTWKIENFSKISKRELRSNVFEVGGYKWYILVYPQGCDVCNHLSLFLCVADYDKLLPGWSHFAQFTIAIVNKDPKKSKYSDTLHRFCKKEHDWGWKKFMELSKVLDGFTVADTLIIKAQVQVIRENPHRPFRCLDCQYRRELVRIYLTNVEGICRRFVEEKREKLGKLVEDSVRWSSFRAFWLAVEENVRHRLSREKADVVLKTILKRFFNEKEVTSTLVMDALYSGCKALDYRSRTKKGKINGVVELDASSPVVWVEKDTFVLADDVMSLLERAAAEPLPPFKDDKGPQNRAKDGSSNDDFGKDSIDRDEWRLTELGRRTIEMFVLAHLFSNRVEVAYREAIALKRQEELIREEEAAGLVEIELRAKREAAEKEKRSKKKQAKQRRSSRKERARDEKRNVPVKGNSSQECLGLQKLKECSLKEHSVSNLAISGVVEEDDLTGLQHPSIVVGTFGPETEDGDVNCIDWDRDSSEAQAAMEASFSGAVSQPAQGGRIARQQRAALDDSSSTCSTDSLPSVVMNGSYRGSSLLPYQYQVLPIRGKDRTDNERYEKHGRVLEADNHQYDIGVDLSSAPEPSSSCRGAGLNLETVILSLKERVNWLEQRLFEKEEEIVSLRKQLRLQQHQMHLERPNKKFQDKSGKRSYARDAELSSHLNVDDVNHESSCMQADDLPINSSNSSSLKELQARHSLSNNLCAQSNNCARNKLAMEMSKEQSPSMLLKKDSVKSSTPMTISTELSRPLPCANSSSSLAIRQGKICGLKDSFFSNIDQSPKLSSSGETEFTDISRPSSAPLIPICPRPNTPIMSVQPVASLARSVSAAGRLGIGVDLTASSCSSLSQSPPVTPSYRNVAAGKMRSISSGGHVPYPVSSAAETTGSCIRSCSPASSIVSSCTMSSPMPSLVQPFGLMRGDSSPSSVSISSCISTPQALMLNGHLQEQIDQNGADMGFTFGTVNPELLHKQCPQELVSDTDGMISQAEERACKEELPEQQQILLGKCLQQQQWELQNQRGYWVQSENDSHHVRFLQASSDKLVVQGPLKNIDSASAIRQAGTLLSEEFPHLDIINYLLDEEQNLGKTALSAMLQHHGGLHSNRQLSFPAFHGISSGQLCPEIHLLNSGGFERTVVQEDDVSQVHCSPDQSSIDQRESMQMVSPYAHSPHAHSYNRNGGIQEGVPSHLWPLCCADLPENNIINNGHGASNASMGYSMRGNSISVGDCSSFTLGTNGYTVFRPMSQP